MARYLVVANLTTESPTLRAEAARVIERDPAAVFDVVVPVGRLPSAVALVSAVDAQTLRRERASRMRQRLASAGAQEISIHVEDREPLDEIDRILEEPGFAAVMVCTPRRRPGRWLRTDLAGRISRRHPELRVRVISAPSDFYEDRPLVRLLWPDADLSKTRPVGLR